MPNLTRLTAAGTGRRWCRAFRASPGRCRPTCSRASCRRARRHRQRVLLARQAAKSKCGRPGTTRFQRRRFGTCCTSTTPQLTSAVWFPMLSKGCGADYICMPGADPQSRRQRIAVVLHEAARDVRHAARRVRPFSADEFLGADGEHQIDRLDRRFGGLARRAAVPAELLLHLPAAPRLRRAEDRPRQPGRAGRRVERTRRRDRASSSTAQRGLRARKRDRSGSSPANTSSRRSIT